MPVARLRLRITSTWTGRDGAGSRQVTAGFGSANRNVTRAGQLFGRTVGGLLSMRMAAVIFAPAIFTIGKAVVALAGGVVALGVVVGAAAAPWVGLAVTAAKNADKMGPAGARFEQATGRVKAAWMDLAKDTASLTLGPLTNVLNGIASAIPKLAPLVKDMGREFGQMGRDIRDWLSGAGFERFLSNVREFGVPAFRNLVAAGRDALGTVGIAFRAFLPLARDMAKVIGDSAAKVHSGALRGSFDRFIGNFRRDWPEVNRFLREAATSLGTLGELLSGMGPGQLGALSTLLGLFNRIDPDRLRDIVLGLAAFFAGKELIGLLAGIALIRSGGRQLLIAGQLGVAAAALSAAAGPIFAMAAAVASLARAIRSIRFTVNNSALDRVRNLWNEIKRGGSATVSAPSVGFVSVQMMGVNSTWAAVKAVAASPIIFRPSASVGAFNAGAIAVTAAWTVVRALSVVPVILKAMAIPGNVPAVAALLIGLWVRVRALSFIIPVFRGRLVNSASSQANQVRSAWQRVLGMPRSWTATARINAGPAVASSVSVIRAWRSVHMMPRSWSAAAAVVVRGGFSGISGPGGGGLPHVDTNYGGGAVIPFGGLLGRTLGQLGGAFSDIFGFGGPDRSDPMDPGDFPGGGFATGGPVGFSAGGPVTQSVTPSRGKDRHIHIHDDIWVSGKEDLVDLLSDIMANAA